MTGYGGIFTSYISQPICAVDFSTPGTTKIDSELNRVPFPPALVEDGLGFLFS